MSNRRMAKTSAIAPNLLLAKVWEGQSLVGWWLSEKLDGVRAYWNGHEFVSRLGNVYRAPAWFTADFPATPLDGELWMGRGQFSELVGAVKRYEPVDAHWQKIKYLVFDMPGIEGTFEYRQSVLNTIKARYIEPVKQVLCDNDDTMLQFMYDVVSAGGEGLMARKPGSSYVGKRSSTLLKIKQMQDVEATVYAYQPGQGKHAGRMGALLCRLDNGVEFKVGTGFSDLDRENPPVLGSRVTVRYQELSKTGVPRFPAYDGVRYYE